MWLQRLENLLLTLWVGAHWSVGYLVAPVLFKTLDDRQMAGMLAGKMFAITAWVGLVVCGILLLSLLIREKMDMLRAWRFWVLNLALILVLVGMFVIQPQMAALKAQGIMPATDVAAEFGKLHGISSVMYLLTSLCGLALVWLGVRGGTVRPRSALGSL